MGVAERAAETAVLPEVAEVLLTPEQIRRRIKELAAEISRDYHGREIHLVCVLRGAWVFAADLMRELTVPSSVDFISISSYGSGSRSSGVVRIVKDLEDSVEGRYVIIVEDIIDTGLTSSYLVNLLLGRKVAGLEVCALLDKPSARKVPHEAKYVGFTVPDAFVIGYGLDYNQRYRGLPYIATLRPDVFGGGEAADGRTTGGPFTSP
jgi:hypoxanthine phosphoribosyltransferase